MESNVESKKSPAEQERAAEDEVSLVELWEILVRRRITVVIVLVVCLVAGGVVAITSTTQYEYSTTLELGHTVSSNGNKKTVEPAVTLQSKLNDLYVPQAIETIRASDGSFRQGIEVTGRQEGELFVITSKGKIVDGPAIKMLHTHIVKGIENDHKLMFDSIVAFYRGEYGLLESQLQLDRERIKRLSANSGLIDGKLSKVRSGHDDTLLSLYVSSETLLTRLERNVVDYRIRMMGIELKLAQSTPTTSKIIATRAVEQLGTGKLVVVALALVLGLFIGILVAFFQEFLDRMRGASVV